MTTTIDVADQPRDQPVTLPARGPILLRYRERDQRVCGPCRVSVGLAEIYLRMAGYAISGKNGAS